jgi:hypothetical protein
MLQFITSRSILADLKQCLCGMMIGINHLHLAAETPFGMNF